MQFEEIPHPLPLKIILKFNTVSLVTYTFMSYNGGVIFIDEPQR